FLAANGRSGGRLSAVVFRNRSGRLSRSIRTSPDPKDYSGWVIVAIDVLWLSNLPASTIVASFLRRPDTDIKGALPPRWLPCEPLWPWRSRSRRAPRRRGERSNRCDQS